MKTYINQNIIFEISDKILEQLKGYSVNEALAILQECEGRVYENAKL